MSVSRITREDLIGERLAASQLDLSSRKRVATDLSGTHLSGFRGRGMEFEEHRAYVPGDEIRSIDWRVTARTGQTHVRSYREERERPVNLAVDLRAPMWFGSRRCFKAVLAARAAARMAWAAAANGDRVGGLCLNRSAQLIRPAGGRRGVLRLFGMLAQAEPLAGGEPAPLHLLLEELRRVSRPGALAIVISDFHDLDQRAEQSLSLTARHCELVLAMVSDPLERQAPPAGRYPVRAADEQAMMLDAGDRQLCARWQQQFEQRREQLRTLSLRLRARSLDLRTEAGLDAALAPMGALAA